MYANHVPIISAAMRADHETFARGCLFSILSARQPIQHVPVMMRDIDANGEDAESLAMLRKYEGWKYLQEHGRALWETLRYTTPAQTGMSHQSTTRNALEHLVENVPGLGIVKAAFVLQFMGHDIGCLDTHNLKRDGISMRAFASHGVGDGKPAVYRKPQFDLYMRLAYGRAHELWDRWCNQIAEMRDYDPMDVSAHHLAVLPDYGRAYLDADIPF